MHRYGMNILQRQPSDYILNIPGASIHGARKQEPVQSGPHTWVFHTARPGYLLIPGSLLFIRSISAVSYRPCVTSFLQGPHHFLKKNRETGSFLLNSLVGTESKK